ncbi:MAG: ATP-binding protein [Myxococcota bacterium]
MKARQGVQAEILLSLALVMVTGTGLLAAVFLEFNQARLESLHSLLGRGFVAEVRSPGPEFDVPDAGIWWKIDASARVHGLNVTAAEIDDATLALGEEARATDSPMIQSGAPWEPIRFASTSPNGRFVIVGRIDAPVSGAVLLLLLGVDVLVFGLCGVSLLRRRVVGPLHRLADSVREMGEAEQPALVPVEGVGEIEALGSAFNEMQAALSSRTTALEKAVIDLRTSNASLLQAREGLDRAERLAMVGSLAAGVAHEVGNPMGALLAFLEVGARDPGLGEQGQKALAKASEQGERVRVIIRQLLDFSRPPRVAQGPVDVSEIAHQVVELVSAQREFNAIEFDVEVDEEAPTGHGDGSLISQILLNLALNAAAEMEGQAAPHLRLCVFPGQLRLRGEESKGGGEDAADRSARIDAVVCSVEDSGPGVQGIDPERIFDPFFTTKDPGKGTGLGLANARRLAAEMGGRVELAEEASSLGGARFLLVLPTLTEANPPDSEIAEGCPQTRASSRA